MIKSRNKKKFKLLSSKALPIALIAILIIVQIASTIYIVKLRESISSLEEKYFLSFVNQVETQRYKRAVVDVSEGRIYIPDARIYTPLTDKNPDLVYDSRTFEGAVSKTLFIATSQVVGNQRSLDDSVDNHSCNKMIMISSTEQSGHTYTFIREMPATKDGLRYIYLHTKYSCGIYSQNEWETAKSIAENIQSY